MAEWFVCLYLNSLRLMEAKEEGNEIGLIFYILKGSGVKTRLRTKPILEKA